MNKFWIGVAALFIVAVMFVTFVPAGRRMINWYDASLKKADEVSYETKKMVEDTARAMIANYQTAVDTYNMYKDNDNPEKQTWAEEARMSAIRTANSYNKYLLENRYVWKDNIPPDINVELSTIF